MLQDMPARDAIEDSASAGVWHAEAAMLMLLICCLLMLRVYEGAMRHCRDGDGAFIIVTCY